MAPITSNTFAPVRHLVQVRRPVDGVPGDPASSEGWLNDPRLMCTEVRVSAGAERGHARLAYVPQGNSDQAVESILSSYSVNTEVRVLAWPHDAPLSSGPGNARRLFEGVLQRHHINLEASERSAIERVRFVAQPMTWLQNRLTDSTIFGRWIASEQIEETGYYGPLEVESIDLPAVFNYRGRPNRAFGKFARNFESSEEVSYLEGPLFTHDDDPQGRFWTVRDALCSLLVIYLFGPAPDGAITRYIDLDVTSGGLAEQLRLEPDNEGERPDQFRGLDATLPEVSVHGMGVMDAIGAVCEAGGFDFACQPIGLTPASEADRSYVLKVWRRHTGTGKYFRLARRGTTYSTAAQALNHNDITKFIATADAHGIVNEVEVRGRTYIECLLPLKPLWNPTQVSGDTVDATLQTENPTPEVLYASGYYAKHHAGGALYHQFSHVGRVWGIDCVGGFAGYNAEDDSSGLYVHDSAGFDFVGELDLDADDSPLMEQRGANGQPDQIIWSNRVRHLLPLSNPTARTAGQRYYLEVSEDGGATWRPCPVRLETLSHHCGISITGVKNLATVNNASFSGGAMPAAASSWWGLMKTKMLSFRVTCTIAADHAYGAFAGRQGVSRSLYRRGRLMHVDAAEVWVQPDTAFNTGTTWLRFAHSDSPTATASAPVDLWKHAEARRAATEDGKLWLSGEPFAMDFDRFEIGDRVLGIQGRNLSFAVNAGTAQFFPNVVGLTYLLAPAEAQGIKLDLDSPRLTAEGEGF